MRTYLRRPLAIASLIIGIAAVIGTVGVSVQGPWTVPPGTNGKVRVTSSAADALCVGGAGVAPTSAQCTGGIYAATLRGASTYTTVTTTSTGTQNNFAPGLSGNTIVLCNNASTLVITGLAGGADGQLVTFVSENARVDFTEFDAGSSAGNKFINLATTAPTSINSSGTVNSIGGHITYQYSSAAGNWVMLDHEQGGWIDYATSSTVTGWGTFTTKIIRYRLSGRALSVWWNIDGASNATTVSFTLPYTSATGSSQISMLGRAVDTGSLNHGRCDSTAGSTTVTCFLGDAAGAWTNINQKIVTGQTTYEVQ